MVQTLVSLALLAHGGSGTPCSPATSSAFLARRGDRADLAGRRDREQRAADRLRRDALHDVTGRASWPSPGATGRARSGGRRALLGSAAASGVLVLAAWGALQHQQRRVRADLRRPLRWRRCCGAPARSSATEGGTMDTTLHGRSPRAYRAQPAPQPAASSTGNPGRSRRGEEDALGINHARAGAAGIAFGGALGVSRLVGGAATTLAAARTVAVAASSQARP